MVMEKGCGLPVSLSNCSGLLCWNAIVKWLIFSMKRSQTLSLKYQGEQKELDAKIQQLHEAMEAAVQTAVDVEKWVELMKQYVNPTELTAELLNTLIEKIFVHEAVKGEDGSREQEVEIFYRFIGKID